MLECFASSVIGKMHYTNYIFKEKVTRVVRTLFTVTVTGFLENVTPLHYFSKKKNNKK